MDELDARLRILTAEELRAAILGHAERLAQRDRMAFLAIFPEAASKSPAPGRQPGEDIDSDLIGDIDTFTAQLDDSDSSDEWAWDRDDGDDHRGDSSGLNSGWPEEMDDLFRRAAESFVRGDLDLARVAYWRLLHVFLDGHEAFGDAETPEDVGAIPITRDRSSSLPPGGCGRRRRATQTHRHGPPGRDPRRTCSSPAAAGTPTPSDRRAVHRSTLPAEVAALQAIKISLNLISML